MNRLERDFYSVIEDGGQKYIHIWGYCWRSDDPDNPHLPYRDEEFTFCFLRPGFTEEEYEKVTSECKHYIMDCSEDTIANIMDDYFGNEYHELPMRSVTEDTPCGDYIDC